MMDEKIKELIALGRLDGVQLSSVREISHRQGTEDGH